MKKTNQEIVIESKNLLLHDLGQFIEKQPVGTSSLELLSKSEVFVKEWFRQKHGLEVKLINLRNSEDGKGIQWDSVEII